MPGLVPGIQPSESGGACDTMDPGDKHRDDNGVQASLTEYRDPMSAFGNILLGGIFHAAVLFLVAAGLQLVFGVQKIVNLACGSFYALGAYFGISSVNWAIAAGLPSWSFLPVLVASGS